MFSINIFCCLDHRKCKSYVERRIKLCQKKTQHTKRLAMLLAVFCFCFFLSLVNVTFCRFKMLNIISLFRVRFVFRVFPYVIHSLPPSFFHFVLFLCRIYMYIKNLDLYLFIHISRIFVYR